LERELEAMLQGAEQEQEEAEMMEEMGEEAASSAVGKGRPLPFVKKTKTVKVRLLELVWLICFFNFFHSGSCDEEALRGAGDFD
jgi:hypothetical protein